MSLDALYKKYSVQVASYVAQLSQSYEIKSSGNVSKMLNSDECISYWSVYLQDIRLLVDYYQESVDPENTPRLIYLI